MSKTRKLKAQVLINESAAELSSLLTKVSLIPVVGGVIGYRSVVEPRIPRLVVKVGELFGKRVLENDAWNLYHCHLQTWENILRGAVAQFGGSIPLVGSIFSDEQVQYNVKVAGWSAYYMFKDRKNIVTITDKEAIFYIAKAKRKM